MQNQLNYLQALITKHFGRNDDRGASAVEYGLLVGLIAVAIVAVLVTLGPHIANMFQQVNDKLPASTSPSGGAN